MKQKYQKLFFIGVFLLSCLTEIHAQGELKRMNFTSNKEQAIFAMGCFWSGATAFEDPETYMKLPGIISVRVGYTGGITQNPTYENHEGHQEAVKIVFDSQIISYEQLLEVFWHNIDPFDDEGQFCDKGPSYVPAIFFQNNLQKQKAEKSKEKAEKALGKSIPILVEPASSFYDAEEYHQDFKLKNPERYNSYRRNCGRDLRLKKLWNN